MTALLRLTAGLIWWAAAFSLLYAAHGISCSLGWSERIVAGMNQHTVLLAGLWAACIAFAAIILLWHMRLHADVRLRLVTIALSITGLVSIVVTGLPIITAPACI